MRNKIFGLLIAGILCAGGFVSTAQAAVFQEEETGAIFNDGETEEAVLGGGQEEQTENVLVEDMKEEQREEMERKIKTAQEEAALIMEQAKEDTRLEKERMEREAKRKEREQKLAEEEARKKAEEKAAREAEEKRLEKRQEIVDFALQFEGNPYVYGGTSLTNGADCSGFVMSVFQNFGYELPRVAAAQMESAQLKSEEEMEPGDLLFYGGSGGIDHVALYIGNGQIIHASTPATGIKISEYNYRQPVAVGTYVE